MPVRLSVKLTVSGDPDAEARRTLDSQTVHVDCPRCRLSTPTTVGELRLETPVVCRGCRVTLRPMDPGADFDFMLRKIQQQFSRIFEGIPRG